MRCSVKKKTITRDDFTENRLGSYSSDLALTPLAEYAVSKITPRHQACLQHCNSR